MCLIIFFTFIYANIRSCNLKCTGSPFSVPPVDFLVKIQEVKATEREDAVFECVLSNPFSKILWFGKNLPLEQGDKYDIQVSEDKLIHKLVVKDCLIVDKGIYSACAGIKSCNAWLVVEGRILYSTATLIYCMPD